MGARIPGCGSKYMGAFAPRVPLVLTGSFRSFEITFAKGIFDIERRTKRCP